MTSLDELARYLNGWFALVPAPTEAHGVWRPSERRVARLGLALEAWPGLNGWATRNRLDAVLLHRPWSFDPEQLAPDIGVLAYHQAFDDRLTLGYNTRLAPVLGMAAPQPFGMHKGRLVGMLGAVPTQPVAQVVQQLHDVFGGADAVVGATSAISVEAVAVVGALSDALVREAASRGAQLYISGQLRVAAEAAIVETGITVVAIGHRRSEVWGLRALAGVLHERWAELTVLLA